MSWKGRGRGGGRGRGRGNDLPTAKTPKIKVYVISRVGLENGTSDAASVEIPVSMDLESFKKSKLFASVLPEFANKGISPNRLLFGNRDGSTRFSVLEETIGSICDTCGRSSSNPLVVTYTGGGSPRAANAVVTPAYGTRGTDIARSSDGSAVQSVSRMPALRGDTCDDILDQVTIHSSGSSIMTNKPVHTQSRGYSISDTIIDQNYRTTSSINTSSTIETLGDFSPRVKSIVSNATAMGASSSYEPRLTTSSLAPQIQLGSSKKRKLQLLEAEAVEEAAQDKDKEVEADRRDYDKTGKGSGAYGLFRLRREGASAQQSRSSGASGASAAASSSAQGTKCPNCHCDDGEFGFCVICGGFAKCGAVEKLDGFNQYRCCAHSGESVQESCSAPASPRVSKGTKMDPIELSPEQKRYERQCRGEIHQKMADIELLRDYGDFDDAYSPDSEAFRSYTSQEQHLLDQERNERFDSAMVNSDDGGADSVDDGKGDV